MVQDRAEATRVAHIDLPPVEIGHVPVHPATLADTLAFIDGVIHDGRRAVIHYANAHAINLAERNRGFRSAMTDASLVFCDGKSLQWAARVLGQHLPERFTPPDWIDRLCSLALDRDYRMFFLGGTAGVAEMAAAKLRKSHPGLEVATAYGFFGRDTPEEIDVIARIRAYEPDVLLVGFGMPLQEMWIRQHGSRSGAKVIMTVGGMFDFVSENKRRGPQWLTRVGLEWLTRLIEEPIRLSRRYLLGNPRFVWIVVKQAWRKR